MTKSDVVAIHQWARNQRALARSLRAAAADTRRRMHTSSRTLDDATGSLP